MVYFQDGKPLFVSGRAASSVDCCCDNVGCGGQHDCCNDIADPNEFFLWAASTDMDITFPAIAGDNTCCSYASGATLTVPFSSDDTWAIQDFCGGPPVSGWPNIILQFRIFCDLSTNPPGQRCGYWVSAWFSFFPTTGSKSSRYEWLLYTDQQFSCRTLDIEVPFDSFTQSAVAGPLCLPAGDPGPVRVAVH